MQNSESRGGSSTQAGGVVILKLGGVVVLKLEGSSTQAGRVVVPKLGGGHLRPTLTCTSNCNYPPYMG